MTGDQNWEEQIDSYLFGKMDAVARLAFEEQLSADRALRAELEVQQKTISVVRVVGREEWKKRLQQLHRDNILTRPSEVVQINEKPATGIVLIRRRAWLAAASVIILITTFLVVHKGADKEQAMFDQNFSPYPLLAGLTRGENVVDTTVMQTALLLYGQGKFREFINSYQQHTDLGNDEQFLFYLGNAYLGADKANLAEITFKKYLDSYSKFATESQWYLALSYLKQHKKTKAVATLRKLSSYPDSYGKKALALLAEIEKMD